MRFMYQGSEPPVMSQSPVPLAFMAGITFQAVLTTRATMNAIAIISGYEFSSHQTLNPLLSRLGAMSPNIPLEAKKIAKKLSQNPRKNHENDPMNPSSENIDGSSLPISCKCPMVYRTQFTASIDPKTCHPSDLKKECSKTTKQENMAHTTPRWLPFANSSRDSSWPIHTSGARKPAKINEE